MGAFSASAANFAKAQQKYNPTISSFDLSVLPPGFDCSQIHEKGIDKQENFRAGLIMIACGAAEGGSVPISSELSQPSKFSKWVKGLLPAPLFIGGTDVDVILPDGTYPHVTQSESMEWGGPNNTWVVNYNDSRTAPSCYSGISYSTDNGATWHASLALCSGHGTNLGDPIVVYNALGHVVCRRPDGDRLRQPGHRPVDFAEWHHLGHRCVRAQLHVRRPPEHVGG